MSDRFASDRQEYERPPLTLADVGDDPLAAIAAWVEIARAAGEPQPTAMCLATASADGLPSARTVLLKGVDDGLVFYTNYDSPKGADLEATGRAAANFTWLTIHRQIRARGRVTQVSAAESDAYFASRPRGAQIAAAASRQGAPIADRQELEAAFAAIEARHPGAIPRPPRWGGYRLIPDAIEFWQGRENRMHDRFLFTRAAGAWTVQRLAP